MRWKSVYAGSVISPNGAAVVAKLRDPLAGVAGHDRRTPGEVARPRDPGQERRGPQRERELADPLVDRGGSFERRLQERPAHADHRRAQRERLRRVETAAHAAGRDDRQPRPSAPDDRDGARHAPVPEDLAEPGTRGIASILGAQRLDRGERRAADPADVDGLDPNAAQTP